MNERLDWDPYFLNIATAVSARADCTRRQVGAVIVDLNRRIIGTGYNGGPMNGLSCLAGECPRGLLTKEQLPSYVDGNSNFDSGPGACIAIHAEINALLYSDVSLRQGATLYSTDEPCANCWKQISNSGIATVMWPDRATGKPVYRTRFKDGRWIGRRIETDEEVSTDG